MGALQSDEGISSHPLLRQFAPMSEPHSPAASAGKPPVEDLPLQRHRRRLFEMQDLLYGARPPASLKTLLAQDGYVKQVNLSKSQHQASAAGLPRAAGSLFRLV